jgi:hypothetical protein
MAVRTRLAHLFAAAVMAAVVWLGSGIVHASKLRQLALDDLVAESGAIVVASVGAVDERAGITLQAGEAMTKVTLKVERVLHGKVADSQVSLLFRTGYLPDGTIVGRSDTPQLTIGDRYVLFLRAHYTSSPLVNARHALLRIVSFGKRSIVVDEDGHALVASTAHGLVHLGQVAASVDDRYVEQTVAQQSESEAGLEPPGGKLAPADVAYASDADDVIALIDDVIARVHPTAAPVPAAPESVTTQAQPTKVNP